MAKRATITAFIVLIIIVGASIASRYIPGLTNESDSRIQNNFPLGDSIGDDLLVDDNANEQNMLHEDQENSNEVNETNNSQDLSSDRPVQITDGVKHTVPLSEIRGGGPAKDGIPSIDDPKFVSIKDAERFVDDTEPGIAVSVGGIDRFYPFQILVWHEIVNDTFGSQRVLISYCPLCLSGIVFDPVVEGKRVEFGTSGKLWNSNLVMYDRRTDAYWSQILGEAIRGKLAGEKLNVLPSDQLRFGGWKKQHSGGEVLSRDTGAVRIYGFDPYGDYYTSDRLVSPVGNNDDRLDLKDFILGVVIDGQAKAYLTEAVKSAGRVEDEFAGVKIIADYDQDLDVVRISKENESGELERINPFPTFWFSWAAVHPNTEVYK